ncbi:hypothetical protein EBQ90_00365, partial [bacterium]|nr:hypothetical protein [bacterium]
TTPAAKLDVSGDVKVGNSSTACSASLNGSIRYNSTSSLVEFCNGSSWSPLIQESVVRSTNGGRLTVVSGSTDVPNTTGASTLYFTPAVGNQIALYDGSNWRIYVFSEFSLALSGLTSAKNYDVFVYVNNGSPALELGPAWTNDTTRATTLTFNSVYTKTGDTTRRYVGTIRATAATTTEDSPTKRFVWNLYNQRPASFFRSLLKSSYSYTTSTWRNFNNDSTVRVEYVTGQTENIIMNLASNLSNAAAGLALDGVQNYHMVQNGSNTHFTMVGRSETVTTTGYHYVQGMEYGWASGQLAELTISGQILN